MLAVLAAIASRLGFNGLSVYWKHFRDKGLNTRAVLGISALSAPLWVLIAFYYGMQEVFIWTPFYFLYFVLWAGAVLCVRLPAVYLLKYQGLTVSEAFRYLFSTLTAFLIDIYFFGFQFSPFLLVGCLLLLAGSLILQWEKTQQKIVDDKGEDNKVRPFLDWPRLIALNLAIALFSVLEFSFGKAALEIQNSFLAHAALYNGVFMALVLLWAMGSIKEVLGGKHNVPLKYLFLMGGIQILSVIAYTYALGQLSVLFMTMIRISGTAVFVFFDHKFREFSLRHTETLLALVFIFLGLVLLAYAHNNAG